MNTCYAEEAVLTIAISTTIARAVKLDPNQLRPHPSCTYLIVIQEGWSSDKASKQFKLAEVVSSRPDVAISYHLSSGIAANRNRCIELAQTPYLWFCDDDIEILHGALDHCIERFAKDPKLDLICMKSIDGNKQDRKAFAPTEHTITRWNSAKFATFEMAVRLSKVKKWKINFDTGFGAGAEIPIGDEYIFISDLLKIGGNGIYIPVPSSVHCADSSGFRVNSWREKLQFRSRIFRRVFGFWGRSIAILSLLRDKISNRHMVR